MTKIDFKQIVPPPPVLPDRPQCDYVNNSGYTYAKQCVNKSSVRIDGKHYCNTHAPRAALKYLEKLAILEDGDANE